MINEQEEFECYGDCDNCNAVGFGCYEEYQLQKQERREKYYG